MLLTGKEPPPIGSFADVAWSDPENPSDPGDSQLSATPPRLPQRAGRTPTWAARIGHVAQAEVIHTGHTVAVGAEVDMLSLSTGMPGTNSHHHHMHTGHLPCPAHAGGLKGGAGCQAPTLQP